jgi:hypothetical protein
VSLSDYERKVLSEIERDFHQSATRIRDHRKHLVYLIATSVLAAGLVAAVVLTGIGLFPALAATVTASVLGVACGLLVGRGWRHRALSIDTHAFARRRSTAA